MLGLDHFEKLLCRMRYLGITSKAAAGKLSRFQQQTFSGICTRSAPMNEFHVTSWYKILDF